MMYELPTSVEINGKEYEIRTDFRAALDILSALSDPELSAAEKALVSLDIFYPSFETMGSEILQEAADKMTWFLNCGDEGDNRKRPKLMDWEQDFQYIVAPINRVIGHEVRSMPHLHWWSFVSAYYEIGDCFFANIVRIRSLKAKGKALDKADRDFYRENKRIVDLKTRYTDEDEQRLQDFLGLTSKST